MLLQELFKPEYLNQKEVYGIEVNEESNKDPYLTPPEHFETLGFVLQLDNEGLISDTLLDIIISYKITNLPIMIEVPAQFITESKVDPKNLISLANNVDFMISLLPPGHPLVSNVTNEQYITLIENFTKDLLNKPNFDKFVFPISSFMEYLMAEKLLGSDSSVVKNFKPDNPYIVQNFSSILDHDSSNLFKEKIRTCLYELYDGAENFDLIAHEIFKGVQTKSEEIFTQHVQNYMQSNQSKESDSL